MKNFFLLSLLLTLLTFLACEKEKTCVACEYYEECNDGTCVLQDNFVKIGDRVYRRDLNIFVGSPENSSCIDTVVFSFGELYTDYWLYAQSKNVDREAYYRDGPIFSPNFSADTFYLPIFNNLESFCTQNEEDWTASVLVRTYLPDSISMDFGFYHYGIDTIRPRQFLETNHVILYPLL